VESLRLIEYSLEDDGDAGDCRLFVQGSSHFRRLLEEAFPALFFEDAAFSIPADYTWGVQFKPLSRFTRELLEDYLSLLSGAVYLSGVHDHCFALSFQFPKSAWDNAKKKNTDRGYETKFLAQKITGFIQRHPIYRRASVIAAVPSQSAEQKRQSHHLLKWIAKETGLYNAAGYLELSWKESTMTAPSSIFAEKSVVLLDDLSQPGVRLEEAEKTLRFAGAAAIYGLTADGAIERRKDDA